MIAACRLGTRARREWNLARTNHETPAGSAARGARWAGGRLRGDGPACREPPGSPTLGPGPQLRRRRWFQRVRFRTATVQLRFKWWRSPHRRGLPGVPCARRRAPMNGALAGRAETCSRKGIEMKRSCLGSPASALGRAVVAAVLGGALFAVTPARADVEVRASIGNAPPAPRMVFRALPHERVFPGERVYIVDDPGVGDSDCFHYGGYYWVFRDGYWYRSSNWRGNFVVVHPRLVPAEFYRLPVRRWKHHPNGPPGLAKRGDDGPPGHMKQQARTDGRDGDPSSEDAHGHRR